MRVVHHTDAGETRVLATAVETADWLVPQARGLMFRRSIPDEYALVFRFGSVRRRSLHMLFVPFDIDAVWVEGERVTQVKRLPAWVGHGLARADTVVEFPAGTAEDVDPGDGLSIDPDGGNSR